MSELNRSYTDDLVTVYEDEFHRWVVCNCPNHVGGELSDQGPHGSVQWCCDRPHDQPPGITRFGKPPTELKGKNT